MTIVERKKSTGITDPVFCKNIRLYFREYCNCSSIHGFRYFGEKRTYFERTWWFIVFSIVAGGCAYAITQVFEKWNSSPVIVSFDTRETQIYSIPFPAVTICPESKSILSLYSHTDIMAKLLKKQKEKIKANLTEEEETNALYMSMLCDFNKFKQMNKTSFTFSEDFFNFIDKVRRKKILSSCRWMKKSYICEELFVPIITDEGVCYTFNMLDREDIFNDNVLQYKNFLQNPDRQTLNWSLDGGYLHDTMEAYPRRAKFPGVKNALSVTLTSYKQDLDPSCKDSVHGFKVLLHTPMRFPMTSSQYFRVPLNEEVLGAIQPTMITTSDTVRVYKPKRRQCYFPSERKLKYFKIYTQLNCNMECLTDLTLKICNCVRFYMPRENGTNVCGASKKSCMDIVEKYLQTVGLLRSLEDLKSSTHGNKSYGNKTYGDVQTPDCDCMPICSDLSYSVETSQAKWNWEDKYKNLYPNELNKNMRKSKLVLYFKTSQFVTSKRHELYGPIDFLANFGGLLGLFTGFSVLSIMELVYFLTIRLYCNSRLYGKWYGPQA